MTKQEREAEIEKRLPERVKAQLTEINADERYDAMLDEIFSFESVGGIFASMLPSRVLKECDPTAYRCGKNDWLDSESDVLEEIDGEYYDRREVDDVREEIDGALDDEEEEEAEAERLAEEREGEEEADDAEQES